MLSYRLYATLLACCIIFGSCGSSPTASSSSKPIGQIVQISAPLGLPNVPIPIDNPPTAETISLGRKLFYDTKLSVDNTVACTNCHISTRAFTDGTRVSTGVAGKTGTRNAPTLLNTAYDSILFWDGRAVSLEEQAAGPITNPVEMNHPHDACIKILNADSTYPALFEKAFGPGPITLEKVEKSLASFERTLLSANSPFDRYQYGSDPKAMSPSAIRGFEIFRDAKRGNCATCHKIEDKYALFTDGKFHNIGVGVDASGELTDLGRYEQTKLEADKGAFKTPTLRNVAKTAPYMHDGSEKTLKEVVDFYAGGGNSNPQLDKEIKEIKLSAQDRADLIAFLESLTGDLPPDSGPPQVTSLKHEP